MSYNEHKPLHTSGWGTGKENKNTEKSNLFFSILVLGWGLCFQ